MTLKNNIGWCDATGNPGIGCRGCELGPDCYALNDTPARVLRAGRWPGHVGEKLETFGRGRAFVRTQKGLSDLRRLNKLCVCDQCHTTYPFDAFENGVEPSAKDHTCRLRRIRFFADSNSDLMDWPIEVLAAALDEIRRAPNVDVILLTKWPELFYERLDLAVNHVCAHYSKTDSELVNWIKEWTDADLSRPNPWVPPNVWILTSVLGNALDEKRLSAVLKIPAAVRGLSCEPLWGSPDLGCTCWLSDNTLPGNICRKCGKPRILGEGWLDWIIVGCDSSKHRRGWEQYETNARAVIAAASAAGVRVYHKQMPVNGRVSHDPKEWPADLRIRQWPDWERLKAKG